MKAGDGVPENSHTKRVGEHELVIVGKVGAPFGLKGWLHVHSFTSPIENILGYQNWYVEVKGQWTACILKEGRRHGQGIVALLENINSPEAAMPFRQNRIGIVRSALASLATDEFYWTDLEGLAVQSKEGESLGKILYLYDNSGVDVMVVKDLNKERHIPFIIHDTVIKVDQVEKRVTVDWDVAF